MTAVDAVAIRRLDAEQIAAGAEALGALFLDAVDDGASIGFMADLTRDQAERYWRDVASVPKGRVVLVADDAQGIAGVVIVAPIDNGFQPHRAEIFKMVVHRRARNRGVGAALMRAAEQQAQALGRTVLTLMTRHGSDGERLYRRLGWTQVGIIRDDSLKPDGSLCDAAIYRKDVGGA